MKMNVIKEGKTHFVQLKGESDEDRQEIQSLVASHPSLPEGSLIIPREDKVNSVKIKVENSVVLGRRKLSDTRTTKTHQFEIAGYEGYITVDLFDDGAPGELFITMAKEGATIGGLLDGIATLTSTSLQYGVPLEVLIKKFVHQRFEPSGFTKNPDIKSATSILDYVFRWIGHEFIPGFKSE